MMDNKLEPETLRWIDAVEKFCDYKVSEAQKIRANNRIKAMLEEPSVTSFNLFSVGKDQPNDH
jgi:hypothetical protein